MNKKDIIDAWAWIRKNNQAIPDDVLDLMKDSAIEKLASHTEVKGVELGAGTVIADTWYNDAEYTKQDDGRWTRSNNSPYFIIKSPEIGEGKRFKIISKPIQRTPLLITDDEVSLYNQNDKYWRVYDDWSIGLFEVSNAASYEVKACFASEEKAKEYVILNKPCLSASDILSLWTLYGEGRQRIIELAKQKLNKQ